MAPRTQIVIAADLGQDSIAEKVLPIVVQEMRSVLILGGTCEVWQPSIYGKTTTCSVETGGAAAAAPSETTIFISESGIEHKVATKLLPSSCYHIPDDRTQHQTTTAAQEYDPPYGGWAVTTTTDGTDEDATVSKEGSGDNATTDDTDETQIATTTVATTTKRVGPHPCRPNSTARVVLFSSCDACRYQGGKCCNGELPCQCCISRYKKDRDITSIDGIPLFEIGCVYSLAKRQMDPFARSIIWDAERRKASAVAGTEATSEPDLPDTKWHRQYIALRDYKNKHGDCNVRERDNGRLGDWVQRQRRAQKQGDLKPDRKDLLDKLGFDWYGKRSSDARFQAHFLALCEFKAIHGHLRVPSESSLSTFTRWQRKYYKDGTLKPERMEKLESIGFVFIPYAKQYERQQRAKDFNSAHDNEGCAATDGDDDEPGNGELSLSSSGQKRKRKLPPAEEEENEEAGGTKTKRYSPWDVWYEELRSFKQEHGHCKVPKAYPGGLGTWVSSQRRTKRKGTMPHDRVAKLDELDFEWEPAAASRESSDAAFEELFDELCEFNAEHGHFKVPGSYSNPDLSKFVHRQRIQWRAGKLSDYRREKLESIRFQWEASSRGQKADQSEWDV